MQFKKILVSSVLVLSGCYAQAACVYTAHIYKQSDSPHVGRCPAAPGLFDNSATATGSTFDGDSAASLALLVLANKNIIGDFTDSKFIVSQGRVSQFVGVLSFLPYQGNATIAGGFAIAFRGNNLITNTVGWIGVGTPPNVYEPRGDAALRGHTRNAEGVINIASQGALTIDQRSDNHFATDLPTRSSGGEGVYLTGSLLAVPADTGVLHLNVANDAKLDVTARGTGILLEQTAAAAAAAAGKGNIALNLSPTSKVYTTTQTTGGAAMGAVVLAQLDAGNKGAIVVDSEADLQFDARAAGTNRGAAVYALHEGTTLTNTNSLSMQFSGQQIAVGNQVAGIRALAQSGEVYINLRNNILRTTGIDTKGVFFGFDGNATSYNPSSVHILNRGLVEITGDTGSTDNVGILLRTNDSAIGVDNLGSIVFRDNTSGYAMRGYNNLNSTGNKDVGIGNSGIIGFAGSNIRLGGIDIDTLSAGAATVDNSGSIFANDAAIRLSGTSSTVDNQIGGTIVSYLSSSGNTTVTNAGTWIAQNDLTPASVVFGFGTGNNVFTNSGVLAVPGTATANAISIAMPSNLQPAVATPLTVSTAAAATAVDFNLGGSNGRFDLGGVVDLQNSTSVNPRYNAFTINGNMDSQGGRWLVDTRLGADDAAGAHSDFLTITGNATNTLTTTIELRNTDGLGAATNTGIELVKVQGTSVGIEFKLGGAGVSNVGLVTADKHKYRLLRRPFAADGVQANATWFLANVSCSMSPAQVSNPAQIVTLTCKGLDKTDTINMPGLAGQCVYNHSQSPASVICTTTAANITGDGQLENNNKAIVPIANPNVRGANGEPVPLFNLFAILGLLGLMGAVVFKRQGQLRGF